MDSSGNARSSAHQLNQFVSHGGQTAVNAGTLTNNGNLTINAGAANNLLKDLPCLNDAVYGYYKEDGEEEEEEEGDEEPICHEGTRTAILAEIDEWLNAENSESIFWISGWAGTGKSTIARTVAKDNIDKGRASASFFFARGKGDRARAKHLTTTITRQLAYSSSSLKPRIISVLERDPEIHHKRLELQWRQLIFGPISEQDGPITNSPISLVIDGLDECEDQKGLGILIDLLRGTHPRNLRLLVTSRPSVLDRFQATETLNCHYQHCVLHTMDGNVVNEDICHFLRDNFRRRRVGIAEKHLQQLVHLAGGLFVWADTAIKFITYDKSFGQKRLNEILRTKRSATEPERKLDEIYLLVLRAAIRPRLSRDELRIYCEAMRHLLGCIVALYSELPPRSLYNLIDNERFSEEDHMISLHEMLKSLRAILDVPDQKDEDSATIQLHHLSLRDFLSDADRCTDERFLVNQVGAHTTLFQNCIRVLRGFREREIPQDVARISIDQKQSYDNPVITPQIEYASLYWVRHLRDSGRAVYDDDDIHQFLKDHALHWLESLSWMEKIDEAVDAMDCLCSLAMDHQSHGLLNFVMGLKEITENRRVLISQSPLQIYSSALIFTPEDNPVRQTCGQEALRWLEYLPKSRKKWRDYLWDHQYYGCDTLSIAFAHSSIALVIRSALCTGVIEAYEPWSGKVLWILGNDGDGITAPTVSQDSEKLAFASHATVHIHEAATGREIQTLTGSEDLIKIAFTGNDQLLLTVSRNCRVAFWDLASGMCLNEVFMDFEKYKNLESHRRGC
ncbi:hypothetical protein BJY01DRAFT_41374 [Aspergillus pseudoustus]|uniref:NACHT domain-containing protein n=1 Tax=Aspergillus pseudoustus TaxID=1810923 RepID=A0ABR4JCP3_9EURO